MNFNQHLRTLAVQHQAIAMLAESRPTLTMANARDALTRMMTEASAGKHDRGTVVDDAAAILLDAVTEDIIPPFD